MVLQVKEGAKNFSAGSVTLDAKMILLPRPVTVRVNDVERFVDDADSTVNYTCTITGLPAGQTAENLGWQLGSSARRIPTPSAVTRSRWS